MRAGVSVGTLYQYFPNKSALLQALLRDKLSGVVSAIEKVSEEMRGARLAEMADALVKAFVAAKFKHAGASVAMYAASEELEGRKIAHEMQSRAENAIKKMIVSSCEKISDDPASVARTLQRCNLWRESCHVGAWCEAWRDGSDGAGADGAGESLSSGLCEVDAGSPLRSRRRDNIENERGRGLTPATDSYKWDEQVFRNGERLFP